MPVGVDLPRRDLVGIEVDRRVRPEVDVAPDVAVGVGEAGHRAARTSGTRARAGCPTASCAAAPRRTRSRRRPRPCSSGSRAGASGPGARSGRGSPRGSCRPRSSSWPAARTWRSRRTARAARSRTARASRRGPSSVGASGAASGSRLTNTRPCEHLDARRHQAERRLVEAGEPAALRHADQATVGAVGPAVVRAAQRLAAVAAALAQPGGAMAADVAERAQLAVLPADHERRLAAGLDGHEAPRLRDLRRRGPRAATCGRRSPPAPGPARPDRRRGADLGLLYVVVSSMA